MNTQTKLYGAFNTTTAQWSSAKIWMPVAEILDFDRWGVVALMEDGQTRHISHNRLVIASEQPPLEGRY